MRIGFDAKRLFRNHTGLGNYSRTLIGHLAKFYPDHDYLLYAARPGRNSVTEPFFNRDHFTIKRPRSIRPFWRRKGITKELSQDQVDVFHGLSHQIPQGIDPSQTRTVVTIHDLIHQILPETYNRFDRMVYDQRIAYALKHSDHVIAISEHTRKDVLSLYPEVSSKISVVYQACDPLFYEETPEQTRTEYPSEYLLYVGSIAPRKNLHNLIRAYGQLKDLPPLFLVGRGDKTYRRLLVNEAAKMGITDKIVFLDNVRSTTQLKKLYSDSQAFLYPSWYEGFGLPVVEATLCKTPVLTSKTSSLEEAGGPNAIYVDPFDVDSLSNGIEQVLSVNEEQLESGYAYACQSFDPEKCTAGVIKVYEAITA